MDWLRFMETALIAIQVLFAAAFGACAGSLINVLAYRLPLGISVVTPPSRCPKCQTRLTWRENIPVFGWLLLRGRCRFCGVRISPEYPIVEAFVAVLFAVFYVLWYLIPPHWPNDPPGFFGVKPEWALGGFGGTWPLFIVITVLLGSLTAMTLTDLKTCTIPLVLTWWPAVVGLVGHTAFALYVEATRGSLRHHAPGWDWAIPTPGAHGWWLIGAGIGGVLGLGMANLLTWMGLIRRSFEDYEAWERAERSKYIGPCEVLDALPVVPAEKAEGSSPADMWVEYPHARREMLKEVVFLSPCFGLAMVGGLVAERLVGPWGVNPATLQAVSAVEAPLWLRVLAGVLLGYLVGGGVVWSTRILGSLGFGKEAMGLGDVHLMAAVGACLGWADAVLAFFGAAIVGLVWAVVGGLVSGGMRRTMPYGPYLAVSTVLVLLTKPWIERGLSAMWPAWAPVNLP